MKKILITKNLLFFACACIFLLNFIIIQFLHIDTKIDTYILFLIIALIFIFICFFIVVVYLQQRSKKMLAQLAYYDELTNLPNKSYFKKQIARILENSTNNYAYVILDLDKFKIINDKWGFANGDNLLRFIANIFRKELAAEELACRATADIFHLLVKFESKEQLIKRLAILSQKIRSYKFSENVLYNLNVYAGIYILENPAISLDIAGDNALLAREKAKSIKNKFYFVYNEAIRAQIVYNQELENVMQESLINSEFIVYLQPKYDLQNKKIVGAEALIRWQHPHKGFETVTIAYKGSVEHYDSTGNRGVIKPGDVQWMTAGAGILHKEFHETEFSKKGGPFEMVQLWVNLPAADKMTAPKYQAIAAKDIPVIEFEHGAGHIRVIAGRYMDGHAEHHGPASTHTPVNVWDGQLKAGQVQHLHVPVDHNVLLVVLSGEMQLNGTQHVQDSSIVMFAQNGEADIRLEALQDSKFLLLTGQPLNEPIQGYGPFVMNSKDEIIQAFNDFNSGKFGEIPVAG